MEGSGEERETERREDYPERFVKHTERDEYLDVSTAPFERVDKPDLSGYYEHYKSTSEEPMYYLVSHVVRNTETDKKLVIYRPLYETGEKVLYARPLEIFLGTAIDNNGARIPRFHRLYEEP